MMPIPLCSALQRSYQGLEQRLGQDAPHMAVEGRTGIASDYGEDEEPVGSGSGDAATLSTEGEDLRRKEPAGSSVAVGHVGGGDGDGAGAAGAGAGVLAREGRDLGQLHGGSRPAAAVAAAAAEEAETGAETGAETRRAQADSKGAQDEAESSEDEDDPLFGGFGAVIDGDLTDAIDEDEDG